MSKSLTNFVNLENQIYWENSPRLMTLPKFKETRGSDSQKWELIEIQDQLNVFCDEVIINNTESISEEFARLLKYAKNKKISYKDCYQYTYTKRVSEGKYVGAERTTGIRIKNLQIKDAHHPKYYNYTADVVSYDVKDDTVLSRQQLSFFFRLTSASPFPEIHWKNWVYQDAYSDITYDDQCIQHIGPKVLK